MDSQRAFEVETYGFTVLESVIDGAHARELAYAVSVADARNANTPASSPLCSTLRYISTCR